MMDRKPIFDAVRKMLGRGFESHEIIDLDDALDLAEGVIVVKPPANHGINDAGIALIKEFEGCKLTAYPDPGTGGEPITIGFGATYYQDGRKIKMGDTITQSQADDLLKHHVAIYAKGVTDALAGAAATPNQHGAMTSLAFNIGVSAFGKSTLLRKHKARDYAGAANEFLRWNRSAGKVMAGLTRRREAEARLYRS